MNIRKLFLTITSIALTLFALGCNAPPPQQLPDIESTVRARVGQVKEVLTPPTAVPLPTYTPYPTFTPQPTFDLQATVEDIVEERLALVEAVATPSPEPPDTPAPRPVQTAKPTSAPHPNPSLVKTPKPSHTYTHPAGYWKISYPSAWKGLDYYPPTFGDNFEIMKTFDTIPLNQTVDVIRFWGPLRRNDLYSFSQTRLRKHSAVMQHVLSFRQVSFRQVTLNQYPAYEAIFINSHTSSSPTQGHLILWTWAGSQAYETDASVAIEEWEEAVERLTKIVHSFEPLSP